MKANHVRRSRNSGTFGAFVAPQVKGVSDEVAVSSRNVARRAKRVERGWTRAGQPPTKSAIHERIARMEARRASKGVKI